MKDYVKQFLNRSQDSQRGAVWLFRDLRWPPSADLLIELYPHVSDLLKREILESLGLIKGSETPNFLKSVLVHEHSAAHAWLAVNSLTVGWMLEESDLPMLIGILKGGEYDDDEPFSRVEVFETTLFAIGHLAQWHPTIRPAALRDVGEDVLENVAKTERGRETVDYFFSACSGGLDRQP